MTNIPQPISDTARALLTSATMRGDYLVRPPKLPIAAARQVVRSLLNAGLVEEVPAPIDDAGFAWRTGEDGRLLMLRATAVGTARVTEGVRAPAASDPIGAVTETSAERAGTKAGGAALADNPPMDNLSENATQPTEDAQGRQNDPNREVAASAISHTAEAAETTSTSPGRAGRVDGLRRAAQALLEAWDNRGDGDHDSVEGMVGPVAALRAALGSSTRVCSPIRTPVLRSDTKTAQVLAMLRRDEGASGPQIAEAMGWAPHTVRGFLAGLAKKGIAVEVLERVRQVNADRQGAKGSYSVYRVAGGPQP
jgi:hypothetical protein